MSNSLFSIVLLGDVVGRPGREAVAKLLPNIIKQHQVQCVVINGENSSGGMGIEQTAAAELWRAGADVLTLGDHAFQLREGRPLFEQPGLKLVRPLNMPAGTAGNGFFIIEKSGVKIGVTNVLGRVFMPMLVDCPFRALDVLWNEQFSKVAISIVDIHAEATSEKIALQRYLDGRFTIIVGTHTHVQTSDNRISANGTASITDLGMCGVYDGVLGMDTTAAITRLKDAMPARYELAEGRESVSGLLVKVDLVTNKAVYTERISVCVGQT